MSRKSRDARAAARAAAAGAATDQSGPVPATTEPMNSPVSAVGDSDVGEVDAATLSLARLIQTDPELRKKAEERAEQRAQDAKSAAKRPSFEPGSEDDPRFFWPKNRPIPTFCRKKETIPCKFCRRIQKPHGGVAVIRVSVRGDIVHFYCKCCRKRFNLDVKND